MTLAGLPTTDSIAEESKMSSHNLSKSPKTATPPAEPVVPDATDEFMAIFLDEAEEILANMQSLLECRQATPHNLPLKKLQRQLHTLKGGARIVGISAMGDLSYSLESVLTKIVEGGYQSNSKLQEIVQNSVDELAAMLGAIRSGVPLEIPTDLIAAINKIIEEIIPPPPPMPAPPPTPAPPPPPVPAPNQDLGEREEDRIRVPVALIDKLTNLVGDLYISHAQMEQTVAQLRDLLRRLSIETEAHILSHSTGSTKVKIDKEECDPQEALKILTQQTDSLLLQQTRIVAELHDTIMRTRMIPFSSISSRLQRYVRLNARELRKQVDFIINGEQIEFELTVFNRLVAPLEHMLKSVFFFGIEDADTRQQAGKPAIAKITLDISQEGTERILKLSDDGTELDLSAIRKKAEERGMIKPDTVISDDELMQFILTPAFSTRWVLTQISGRGIGMDVVTNEIKQLGGSLHIHSKSGQETWFEIRLPHSLTTNQALLVHDIPPQIVEVVEEAQLAMRIIMVVDDSITVRKVTAQLLKRHGMEVLTAKDGIDAVAQLHKHVPDLILLGVEMPRMDGYELATQIRNTPDWKHLPIIMITSRTGAKHRDRAEKIGIDRYLGKPFNETELLENINALLNDRASQRLL
jgi:chemosensory pili system protein ChpA (sensor histidine kinase/response regulator)